MNIIKVQQTFKRLPDEKVAEYVRDPALGFIALMELNERKKERDSYQAQSKQPDISLAERIPQELGIMSGAAPAAPRRPCLLFNHNPCNNLCNNLCSSRLVWLAAGWFRFTTVGI